MFEILNKRNHFWQWDIGQKIIVDSDVCSEVHFCNGTSDCSLVCEVYEENGVRLANVPNILLQDTKTIKVYAYICDGDDSHTRVQETFPVFPRSKPDSYVYTETEIVTVKGFVEKAFEASIDEMEEIADSAALSAERAEQVAVANGYADFYMKNGRIYLVRTENIVDKVDFELREGRMVVKISG